LNNSVKKIAFTFWDGPQLSLLNILSILSFARLNPDVKFIIYTLGEGLDINAGWKTGEHSLRVDDFYSLNDVSSEPNIEIVRLDFQKLKKITTVVQVADYIRIQKLYEHGGIWLDTDVLFSKKVPEKLWDIALSHGFIISYENTITTGFMGFPKGSAVVQLALQKADFKMTDGQFEKSYQAFGPELWSELFLESPEIVEQVQFLSEKLVYPILWKNLDQIFFLDDDSINYEETIGFHWYGGSAYSRSFVNNNLVFSMKKELPLTNFQKMIFDLDNKIGFLNTLPLPINR
jgi:hypothetical protein